MIIAYLLIFLPLWIVFFLVWVYLIEEVKVFAIICLYFSFMCIFLIPFLFIYKYGFVDFLELKWKYQTTCSIFLN